MEVRDALQAKAEFLCGIGDHAAGAEGCPMCSVQSGRRLHMGSTWWLHMVLPM